MRLRDYIPEDVLKETHAAKFIAVLDEALFYKESQVNKIANAFNPVRLTNVEFLKKFLAEFGAFATTSGMPRRLVQNVIMNAYNIYAFRGTPKGIKMYLRAVTGGDCVVHTKGLFKGDEFFAFNDPITGFFPNDDDISTLEDGYEYVPGDGHKPQIFYWFEDNVPDLTNSIEIRIKSPYANHKEFRQYLMRTIPLFIPFSSDTTNIILKFYGGTYVSTRNFKTYLDASIPETIQPGE